MGGSESGYDYGMCDSSVVLDDLDLCSSGCRLGYGDDREVDMVVCCTMKIGGMDDICFANHPMQSRDNIPPSVLMKANLESKEL